MSYEDEVKRYTCKNKTVHGRSFLLQNIEDLDKYFDSPTDEIRSCR